MSQSQLLLLPLADLSDACKSHQMHVKAIKFMRNHVLDIYFVDSKITTVGREGRSIHIVSKKREDERMMNYLH